MFWVRKHWNYGQPAARLVIKSKAEVTLFIGRADVSSNVLSQKHDCTQGRDVVDALRFWVGSNGGAKRNRNSHVQARKHTCALWVYNDSWSCLYEDFESS